jgi:transcriptional regulator with XRE-family HTH domain
MDSIDNNRAIRKRIFKIIGSNIRRLRRERKLSQQALSDLASCNVKFISEIETGRKNPCAITLLKLSLALGVPSCENLTLTKNRCRFRK